MDSSEIDPEMAAFMGFSSFGTQPAAKKRKYNHRTDAVSSATTDSATGANQIALASRAARASACGPKATTGANADEIVLDVDVDSDADNNNNNNNDAAAAAGADDDNDDGSKEADNDEEEGGASLYSDPTRAPALAHAQGLIDEMTTRGCIGSGSGENEGEDGAPQALGSRNLPPTTLPKRPDASWGAGDMGSAPTRNRDETLPAGGVGRGGGGRHQRQHQHQRANDGKPWWEGYYDPKSNENPWEKLEKAAGVASRATWSTGTTSSSQTQTQTQTQTA